MRSISIKDYYYYYYYYYYCWLWGAAFSFYDQTFFELENLTVLPMGCFSSPRGSAPSCLALFMTFFAVMMAFSTLPFLWGYPGELVVTSNSYFVANSLNSWKLNGMLSLISWFGIAWTEKHFCYSSCSLVL